jgi:signal transduction histidine kinase
MHRTIISEEVIRCFSGTVVMNYDSENHYIEMTIPIINPDDKDENVLGVMLVSVSTDNITLNLIYLRRVAIIIFVIVATIMAFFGIVAVVYLMGPFKKLSTGISSVSTGYGSDSLEVFNYTETARICESFNETIARMRVMDESRQEFVSNVSHELKTPMTSMKVLADSINSMPDAPKEMYQEFMADITNEICPW